MYIFIFHFSFSVAKSTQFETMENGKNFRPLFFAKKIPFFGMPEKWRKKKTDIKSALLFLSLFPIHFIRLIKCTLCDRFQKIRKRRMEKEAILRELRRKRV